MEVWYSIDILIVHLISFPVAATGLLDQEKPLLPHQTLLL